MSLFASRTHPQHLTTTRPMNLGPRSHPTSSEFSAAPWSPKESQDRTPTSSPSSQPLAVPPGPNVKCAMEDDEAFTIDYLYEKRGWRMYNYLTESGIHVPTPVAPDQSMHGMIRRVTSSEAIFAMDELS